MRWSRKHLSLLRLIVLVLLSILGVQSTLAFAIPCKAAMAVLADDSSSPCSDDEDDGENCPCPVQCPGCTGFMHAEPSRRCEILVAAQLMDSIDFFNIPDRQPPVVEPFDILHVPKIAHAA